MGRRGESRLRLSLADRPVGIYAGAGASHSWTWLVDCLEAQGVPSLRLLDEQAPAGSGLEFLSAFIIGGGDPQAMAAAMGPAGAAAIRRFVEAGGLYIGFCAGAYLPIPLGLPVMDPFVMTGLQLANVVDELPPARTLPTKLATPYLERYVLHAAREGLLVRSTDHELGWPELIEVPLYGGAPMVLGPDEEALAHFAGFTPRTLLLVEDELAERILRDRVAACRRRVGRGELYLFAPHLENPHYRAGHALLLRLLEEKAGPTGCPDRYRNAPPWVPPARPDDLLRLRHVAADARIVAFALEFEDVCWRLGEKYYEPGKIVVLLDALWRRLSRGDPGLTAPLARELSRDLEEVLALLKSIRRGLQGGEDTLRFALTLFPLLGSAVRRFVDAYLGAREARAAGAAA